MKLNCTIIACLLATLSFGQTWEKSEDLPSNVLGRNHAFSFSLNGYGYLGAGYHQGTNSLILSDFFKFDPETNA